MHSVRKYRTSHRPLHLEKQMNFAYFLVVLAWIFAPLSTIWSGLLVYWSATYPGSIEEICDRLQGVRKVFRPGKPAMLAIICWAYIVTYYFG